MTFGVVAVLKTRLASLPRRPSADAVGGSRGVDVGRDAAGRGGELLAQPSQLEDLVAQGRGALELEVAGGLLHLRLEPAHHRRDLLRLLAGHLELGPLLGDATQALVDVADLLDDRLGRDAVLGVVGDLLLATPVRLVDGASASSRWCGRRT